MCTTKPKNQFFSEIYVLLGFDVIYNLIVSNFILK